MLIPRRKIKHKTEKNDVLHRRNGLSRLASRIKMNSQENSKLNNNNERNKITMKRFKKIFKKGEKLKTLKLMSLLKETNPLFINYLLKDLQ